MAKQLPPAVPDVVPQPVLVGIDDGHAQIKSRASDGSTIVFPSRVRRGHGLSVGLADSGATSNAYETEGISFQVDGRVEGEATQFNEYPYSAINRVLVHHALREAGLAGQRVEIATGLPFSHYYKAGKRNAELIQQKRRSLLLPVTAADGSPVAEIVEVRVMSEAVAAYVDFCWSDEGICERGNDGAVAIVDIGGRTFDTVVILPGFIIDHGRSGTLDVGVLSMVQRLAALLSEKFGVQSINQVAVADAIRTNQIRLWGQPHDVTDEVESARRHVAGLLEQEVSRMIGDGADLEHVVFVGGGADVFPDLAARFRNSLKHESPQLANADGLLKFLKFLVPRD